MPWMNEDIERLLTTLDKILAELKKGKNGRVKRNKRRADKPL